MFHIVDILKLVGSLGAFIDWDVRIYGARFNFLTARVLWLERMGQTKGLKMTEQELKSLEAMLDRLDRDYDNAEATDGDYLGIGDDWRALHHIMQEHKKLEAENTKPKVENAKLKSSQQQSPNKRNSDWQDGNRVGEKLTLVHHLEDYVFYLDQYKHKQEAIGYVDKVEVKITINRFKENWGSGQYAAYEDFYSVAIDEGGHKYIRSYNTWGDGMGAVHGWYKEGSYDRYNILRKTWAGLPVIDAAEASRKDSK